MGMMTKQPSFVTRVGCLATDVVVVEAGLCEVIEAAYEDILDLRGDRAFGMRLMIEASVAGRLVRDGALIRKIIGSLIASAIAFPIADWVDIEVRAVSVPSLEPLTIVELDVSNAVARAFKIPCDRLRDLPLCRGIAHALGGGILVNSTPRGIRFRLVLPLEPMVNVVNVAD
jgi:hypothetical protein